MDISITGQGLEFLYSILMGVGLGIVYDVMRIFRGRIRFWIITAILDVVFWAVCSFAAFWFAMGIGGGQLRLFAMAGIAVGAAIHFLLLSRPVRAVGFFLADGTITLVQILLVPVNALLSVWQRVCRGFLKTFSYMDKQNRIKEHPRDMKLVQSRAERYSSGGITNEIKKIKPSNENNNTVRSGIRRGFNSDAAGSNQSEEASGAANAAGAGTEAGVQRRTQGGYFI